MAGARTHGSLANDDEVNAAEWAAGRGAVVGASKVRPTSSLYTQEQEQIIKL